MVKSKEEFEALAARYNVNIKSIWADNGVYASNLFRVSCEKEHQKLTFCAVGGHWQNGIAERFIGTVQRTANTIFLHGMAQWPDTIREDFWPFAVQHAVNFHNACVRSDKKQSPHYLFTGQKAPWKLKDFKVWGCPVFVLDKKMQDGDSLKKWRQRSWQGVYVGSSLMHAGNVPLIYNPITTHTSPQFHAVFDEGFTTVIGDPSLKTDEFYTALYQRARWDYSDRFAQIEDLYTFDNFWQEPPLSPAPPGRGRKRKLSTPSQTSPSNTNHIPPTMSSPTPNDIPTNNINNTNINDTAVAQEAATLSGSAQDALKDEAPRTEEDNDTMSRPTASKFFDAPAGEPQWSTKDRPQYAPAACSTEFNDYKRQKGIDGEIFVLVAPSTIPLQAYAADASADFHNLLHELTAFAAFADIPNDVNLQALNAACNNKEDTLTQSQMLNAPDAEAFIKAQPTEISGLEDFGVFQYESISKLPPSDRLLNAIWSYRRKRKPTGELLKIKTCICVDGSQQELGRDYWETYAPVVSWSTVRLVMLLSTIMNLHNRQVDYTQAFPQAVLEDPVYMKIPQGWYVGPDGKLQQHEDPRHMDKSHFIKLLRNLYGCKQAARNWFTHLNNGLLAQGFKQSTTDSCLYLRHDCILVVYTDDCLIFAPSDKTID
mmetsp:Transcript_21733/g.31143  ORF Transcript_21733/g.31143 Transcript_21733/m.31143 type:complete len:655 (-) Transcript_21733:1247-3211(-)